MDQRRLASMGDANGATLAELMDASTRKSPYFGKDRRKAERATQMIGQGSPRSSTAAYAKACGPLANTGRYGPEDIVFVSAEGARSGRFAPSVQGVAQGAYRNLALAVAARAGFILDVPSDRNRGYNQGEREVATLLAELGCVERSPGVYASPAPAPAIPAPAPNARHPVPVQETGSNPLGDGGGIRDHCLRNGERSVSSATWMA